MASEPKRVYWDSCVYVDCIQRTAGRWEHIEPILRQAETGDVVFVASALIIAEVVKCEGAPDDSLRKIRDFLRNPYIAVRSVDRFIAERAAEITRTHGIKPPDAIHIATAMRWKCVSFQTFDGLSKKGLLRFDGKIGSPPLKMEIPAAVSKQQSLFAAAEAQAEKTRKPVMSPYMFERRPLRRA